MFDQREIYRFDLPGDGPRYADPMAVRRRLLAASDGRLWEWARRAREHQLALAAAGDAPGEEADARRAESSARLAECEGAMADAAYQAFDGFAPIDPTTGFGTPEAVALGVLRGFLEWLEQKKSPPATSPTSSSMPAGPSPGG